MRKTILILLACFNSCILLNSARADLTEIPAQTSPESTFDLLGLPQIPDNKAIQEKLEAISKAVMNRNLSECEKLVEELKQLDKSLPASAIMLARILMQTGNLGDAIARIEQHLMTAPNDPAAYVTLSDIAVRTQRWTEAALLADQAEKLISEDSTLTEAAKSAMRFELLGRRSDSAMQRQKYALAEECLQERMKMRPDDATSVWVLGNAKLQQDDLNAAIELMKQARKLNPKLPQPELMVAMHLSTKQNAETETWFRNGIKATDVTTENWAKYFQWLLLQNRAKDLIAYHDKISAEMKSNRDIRFLRALAARYVGDSTLAEKMFSELHQGNPEDLECADQLAQVLVESSDEGKRGRAAQLAEMNLRRAPNVENTIATAAWVQYKLGAINVADRLLGELTSRLAISPQTAYYVSEVLRARGKVAEADQVVAAANQQPGIFVQRKATPISTEKPAEKPAASSETKASN